MREADLHNITILLVEDLKVTRRLEQQALSDLGFGNIATAEDGDDAVSYLEAHGPVDLVISDWNMPNRSGLDLLIWLRRQERFRGIPFIMATAQAEEDQRQRVLQAGGNDVVVKPFDPRELMDKIRTALGVAATAPGSAPGRAPSASGKPCFRIAHIQVTDHLVLGVLRHLMERGEIRPRHYTLETRCMPGWNPVREALKAGSVEGAFVLAPIAMDLFAHDVPIRLILLAHKNGSTFVRSSRGAYEKPYQGFFMGRSFMIPHKLSVHHMMAHLFFSRIGMRSGMVGEEEVDVAMEVVDPIQMPRVIASQEDVCGFMVAEPMGAKTVAEGAGEVEFVSGELWDSHPCCVVAMRSEAIAAHPEAVQELTRHLVQAGRFAAEQPEETGRIAVPFLDPEGRIGVDADLIQQVITDRKGLDTRDLLPDLRALTRMNAYMVHSMGVGRPVRMADFVDARFAEAAYADIPHRRQISHLVTDSDFILELLHRSAEIRTVPPGTHRSDAAQPEAAGAGEAASGRLNILIADDQPEERERLAEILSPFGNCHFAEDGVRAVRAVARSYDGDTPAPYDLICLDAAMPQISGILAAKTIREMEAGKGIDTAKKARIFLLSDPENRESVISGCYESGADYFFIKPVNPEQVSRQMVVLDLIEAAPGSDG